MPRTIVLTPAKVDRIRLTVLAAVLVFSAGWSVTGLAQTKDVDGRQSRGKDERRGGRQSRGKDEGNSPGERPARRVRTIARTTTTCSTTTSTCASIRRKRTISGKNTIRFRMLKDDTRIQLDLSPALAVDKILFGEARAQVRAGRGRGVRRLFRRRSRKARSARLTSTIPESRARRGGSAASHSRRTRQAARGSTRSCEMPGASVWWPNKDQWRDEVESMDLSVTIPNELVDVSNGAFVGKKDLGDGTTRWDWHISYPINNYCVSLNIGNYVHFSDSLGELNLDFYVLPENLEKAKKQFAQAKGMLEAFQHYFGEYPFKNDGYKLIEVPYAGMEHQSAVTYGNQFKNGYIGPRLDGRRDQPAIRLHHHSRKRPRVVRQQRERGRPVGHVDPGGLDDVSGVPLRGIHVRP